MDEAVRVDAGDEPARLTCNGCGAQAEAAQRWRWSTATDERGITTTLCADCARDNARSIEAKLDDGWW